jgi:uncharacterized damage-inducible protein DinB
MSHLDHVRRCLLRDIDGTIRELEAFPDDASVWVQPAGVPNSPGTLALHLSGNLRHFIGALLGQTGYVRDRAEEFAARDLPRAELINRLRAAHEAVDTTLRALDPAVLETPFPVAFGSTHLITGQFLVHLATHTCYHLGQIDYCRRISTGDGATVSAVDFQGLATA